MPNQTGFFSSGVIRNRGNFHVTREKLTSVIINFSKKYKVSKHSYAPSEGLLFPKSLLLQENKLDSGGL